MDMLRNLTARQSHPLRRSEWEKKEFKGRQKRTGKTTLKNGQNRPRLVQVKWPQKISRVGNKLWDYLQ